MVTLTKLFMDELTTETARTKRALEQVPVARGDWKPHEKSMTLARLSALVATMPSWVAMVIQQPSLDLNPPGGGGYQQPAFNSNAELVAGLDKVVAEGQAALRATTDDFLTSTNWQLLAGGQVVMDLPRHVVLRDTINHWSHHRGQLTVYLRLLDAKVPSIYGPSADDPRFA